MSQHQQIEQKLRTIAQETQTMGYQFFGFVDMMHTYINQRVADTLTRVQQQEVQLVEFTKGQAQEDIKLCQLISQNQTIFEELQRQYESFNKNTEIYMQNPQSLVPQLENNSNIQHFNKQRQTAVQQLVEQAMNAIGVDLQVVKHQKNQEQELHNEPRN